MADRVQMTSPVGKGTARVPAGRVEEFKANGWREVARKPAPRRRKPAEPVDED